MSNQARDIHIAEGDPPEMRATLAALLEHGPPTPSPSIEALRRVATALGFELSGTTIVRTASGQTLSLRWPSEEAISDLMRLHGDDACQHLASVVLQELWNVATLGVGALSSQEAAAWIDRVRQQHLAVSKPGPQDHVVQDTDSFVPVRADAWRERSLRLEAGLREALDRWDALFTLRGTGNCNEDERVMHRIAELRRLLPESAPAITQFADLARTAQPLADKCLKCGAQRTSGPSEALRCCDGI